MATPRLIQTSLGCEDGILIIMTKFVECPVVDNMPLRDVSR